MEETPKEATEVVPVPVSDPAKIGEDVRERIVRMLTSGEFPTDAEIARECNITVDVWQYLINHDSELKRLRKQAETEMVQQIERSSMQLAINGKNQIARQKAQEFMLKKLMPDKYGENANINDSARSMKRVIMVRELPVIDVDENGIPVATSHSPLR